MSNTIFTFNVSRPYFETFTHTTLTAIAQGGRTVRLAKLPAEGLFTVSKAVILLASTKNDVTDFIDFFTARRGGYDSFLYKPLLDIHNSVTAESIGTGDDVEDEFALDYKYVDSSTLVVSIDGTPTSAYTLSGNYTAPLITFDSVPAAAEALTATYDFYIPCTFNQDSITSMFRAIGATDDEMVVPIKTLTWSQDYSGSHKV